MSEGEAAATTDGGQAAQRRRGQTLTPRRRSGSYAPAKSSSSRCSSSGRSASTRAPWPQSEQEQPQQEPQSEIDFSYLDDPALDPREQNEQLAKTFNQLAQQTAEQIVEQRLAPMQEALQEERWHREAADLVGEFPELGDAEMQDKLFNQKTGAAVQLAQHAGHPELAREPWFWRQSYLALKGMEAAQAEQGADAPGAAHLEGGTGANPGGGQVDLGDLIVGGGGDDRPLGGRVLDFG